MDQGIRDKAASIAEMRNRPEDGALVIQISRHTWDVCLDVADACLKLQQFKQYVHGRLDAAGVPTDPESTHRAEGCRIGGRLDLVLVERSRLHDAYLRDASESNPHEPSGDGLLDRLRGVYTIPVNDGAGPLNGSMTFTRKFPTLPLNLEAATEIERLRALLATHDHLHNEQEVKN